MLLKLLHNYPVVNNSLKKDSMDKDNTTVTWTVEHDKHAKSIVESTKIVQT